jgi:hypothetical protein
VCYKLGRRIVRSASWFCITSSDEFPASSVRCPLRCRRAIEGPGLRPHTSFSCYLRRDIPTNVPVSPTCDNLVLVSPGSPTMSPSTGSGSGKETPPSFDGITTWLWLDRLEELVRAVTSNLRDVKQRQQGLGVSLIRLE